MKLSTTKPSTLFDNIQLNYMRYFILLSIIFLGCKKSSKVEVVQSFQSVPLAPSELNATVFSLDQINLTWKDNSNNESGFKIERKTDTSNYIELGSTNQDITNYSDKSIKLNTNYTYRVYSFNQIGKSVNNSNDFTTKSFNVPTLTTTSITAITSTNALSGGNISADGGSPITTRGVVWSTNSNPTIALSTKTIDSTGKGIFSSMISGLSAGTKYYVRAYATNGAGTAYGEEISFTSFTFSTVVSANGRIWMDRNLGASRVATSSSDSLAYGDLYQWGRISDGHQSRTSGTTNTKSVTDIPGNSLFVLAFPDWRSPKNDILWQGVNGLNNACPIGFRLPTLAEWNSEIATWSSKTPEGAFASPLKLSLAGNRNAISGSMVDVGIVGNYWSSTVNDINAHFLYFNLAANGASAPVAGTNATTRTFGLSVRCIKD